MDFGESSMAVMTICGFHAVVPAAPSVSKKRLLVPVPLSSWSTSKILPRLFQSKFSAVISHANDDPYAPAKNRDPISVSLSPPAADHVAPLPEYVFHVAEPSVHNRETLDVRYVRPAGVNGDCLYVRTKVSQIGRASCRERV